MNGIISVVQYPDCGATKTLFRYVRNLEYRISPLLNLCRTPLILLFDIESVDESIVKNGIDFDKTNIEKNLTLFLYPDDSDEAGELLRIYQQYFMVSNAAQLILKEMNFLHIGVKILVLLNLEKV